MFGSITAITVTDYRFTLRRIRWRYEKMGKWLKPSAYPEKRKKPKAIRLPIL